MDVFCHCALMLLLQSREVYARGSSVILVTIRGVQFVEILLSTPTAHDEAQHIYIVAYKRVANYF